MDPLSREYQEKLSKLSPFEIKNELIEFAKEDTRKSTNIFLNAGRGNPNWISYDAREAFFLLGSFAMSECKRVYQDVPGIAGVPSKAGIADRYEEFLKNNIQSEAGKLLADVYDYALKTLHADRDDYVLEITDGIIGDYYPTPDRILVYTEKMIQPYLAQEMSKGDPNMGKDFDLFATEGGTAAMCYLFDSLQVNHLVNKGDKIALMAPMFTPYLEIPDLDRFSFDVVEISANKVEADGFHYWQYPPEEIAKLKDPSIKLVCCINPSNPPSYRLSDQDMNAIVDIVKNDNPNLMIITDDVYATFATDFQSFMYTLPYNTLTVYSFSKYFGATGWRLAVIAANKDNIFDKKIAELPEPLRKDLWKRYSTLSLEPDKIKFIDRLVADSRDVALNHTAGLSTPQQIQMALFAGKCLVDKENAYKEKMQALVHERMDTLWKNMGFVMPQDALRVGYYSEIDMMVWAKKLYGEAFADWLPTAHNPLDVTVRMAVEKGIVVLNGSGFDGPDWSIRTSQANLTTADFAVIGKHVREILEEYHNEFLKATAK